MVEPDLPHKMHPTVKLDFVAFFCTNGKPFICNWGESKMTVGGPGELPFLSLF